MKFNAEHLIEHIFAYIKTVEAYDSIVCELPLSIKLQEYSSGEIETLALSELSKADSAYIDIRLMLQRKYFCRDENVYLPGLLKAGKEKSLFDLAKIADLLNELDSLNNMPMELTSPNGAVMEGNYKIAETIIYSHYLHADTDKLDSLLNLPMQTVTLLIAPFVLGRERILYEAKELFLNSGIESPVTEHDSTGFLRYSFEITEGRNITASPFWKNAYGHDASYDEICDSAQANSLDDNIVILLAATFLRELAKPEYDVEVLRDLIWEDYWKDWGDFSEAHEFMVSFEHPGITSKVLHHGGKDYAQVKVFPHVIEPWVTSTAQYPLTETCQVLCTKRKNKWKINGLMRSVIDED